MTQGQHQCSDRGRTNVFVLDGISDGLLPAKDRTHLRIYSPHPHSTMCRTPTALRRSSRISRTSSLQSHKSETCDYASILQKVNRMIEIFEKDVKKLRLVGRWHYFSTAFDDHGTTGSDPNSVRKAQGRKETYRHPSMTRPPSRGHSKRELINILAVLKLLTLAIGDGSPQYRDQVWCLYEQYGTSLHVSLMPARGLCY